MQRIAACGLVLVGVLLTGAIAVAQDDYRPLPDSVKARFARADKNGDKKLSLDEFLATVTKEQAAVAKRDFELFDQDSDGQLTLKEFWSIPTVAPADQRGPLPDPMAGLVQQFIGAMDRFFKDWDQEPDRKIPAAEFLAEYHATVNELPTNVTRQLVDQNGDQLVSRAEARRFVEIQFGMRRSDGKPLREPTGRVAQHMQFQHADQNKDDRLDHAEFISRAYAGEKAEEIWTNGDKDKDGFVTWDEWCSMPGRMFDPINEFRRLDTNLDGQLDPDELMANTPDWIKISAKTAIPAFDFDHNGKLSLAEYRLTFQANPVLRWNDIILDPDGDGKISRQEFVYDRSAPLLRFVYFRWLDQNGDGELDSKEFVFKLRIPREFYSLNADGTGWRRMFDVKEFPSLGSPVVSPDGKRIAFDGHRAKGALAGQTMLITDLDGGNLRVIGPGMMPNWNKEGTELAFSNSGIQVVNLKSKETRQIGNGWGGQWSPDGTRIAYYQRLDITTYELATGTRTIIYDGTADGFQSLYWNMKWSPDSQRIVFKAIDKTGADTVASVYADPKNPRLKVHHSGKSITAHFSWSPDGKRVVFCMYCPERKVSQVYEFDPDADAPPKLVAGQDPNVTITSACWTPDGKTLFVITGDY